ADYIGAVTIGTAIFNFIYWNFGFLRMGTSGFAAQACGERNSDEQMAVMLRALALALLLGLIIIVLQKPLGRMALYLLNSGEVGQAAGDYFRVRVWSAPATLALYVFKGWFIGMQNTRIPMWVSIGGNVLNIGASLFFVSVMEAGVAGIALGTAISEYISLIVCVIVWLARYGYLSRYIDLVRIFDMRKMAAFFAVNGDIFIRTLCLVAVTTFFVSASAARGAEVLAVNSLSMQLFTLFSYFMDGFAYSAEALTGRFTGEGDKRALMLSTTLILRWGVGMAIFFTMLYGVVLRPVMRLFTDDDSLLEAVMANRLWIMAVPLTGFLAFIYDGILVGATLSAIMRNVMIVAALLFFVIYHLLGPMLGNDALWCAFIIYLLARGVLQMWLSCRSGKIPLK
ncbi:MAG: MATE family efflux transporter, partial [Rikenellaceae bacterium]|nr:MATE family efflux transporter [Rikenellaceae bacterium]